MDQPVGIALTSDELIDVGTITVNWASAESMLGFVLIQLQAPTNEHHVNLILSLRWDQRLEAIKNMKLTAPARRYIKELINYGRNIKSIRNHLSHSMIAYGPEGRVFLSKKGTVAIEHDTLRKALDQSRYVFFLCNYLMQVCINENYPAPAWPSRPAL